MMGRRCVAAMSAFLLLVVAVAVAARVQVVNDDLPSASQESYGLGAAVAIDGAYLEDAAENTEGYYVTVNSAELMSYNQYIERYGTETATAVAGYDAPSVVTLNVMIENRGNAEGYLHVNAWRLVPSSANDYLIPASDLWGASEKYAPDEIGVLRLNVDSAYATHIPFVLNKGDGEKTYTTPIEDSSFTLHVTDWPTHKTITFSL